LTYLPLWPGKAANQTIPADGDSGQHPDRGFARQFPHIRFAELAIFQPVNGDYTVGLVNQPIFPYPGSLEDAPLANLIVACLAMARGSKASLALPS